MALTGAEKVDLLRRTPLFAECSSDELTAVAQTTDELLLAAGDVLTRRGKVLTAVVQRPPYDDDV